VLLDMRVYWEGPGRWDELDEPGQALVPSSYDAHRRLPQGTSRENLVLADWYVAASELREATSNGCQLLVDLTTTGLRPNRAATVESCRLAGLPVVLPVGRYLGHALEESEIGRTVEELCDEWNRTIDEGVEGYQVGIIGEIGTSAEISSIEDVSLRAAARVQARSGLPLNIHVDPFGRQGHTVLDVLEHEGADLGKVALSHCDGDIDVEWLAGLAKRGAYVEFDLFGTDPEWVILGRGFNADAERIRAIVELADRGLADRLLLSHDICMKNSLLRYGGWGYGHVGRTVLPALDAALGESVRVQLASVNPLRFLAV
jgi:phosphotriesterase-related protein